MKIKIYATMLFINFLISVNIFAVSNQFIEDNEYGCNSGKKWCSKEKSCIIIEKMTSKQLSNKCGEDTSNLLILNLGQEPKYWYKSYKLDINETYLNKKLKDMTSQELTSFYNIISGKGNLFSTIRIEIRKYLQDNKFTDTEKTNLINIFNTYGKLLLSKKYFKGINSKTYAKPFDKLINNLTGGINEYLKSIQPENKNTSPIEQPTTLSNQSDQNGCELKKDCIVQGEYKIELETKYEDQQWKGSGIKEHVSKVFANIYQNNQKKDSFKIYEEKENEHGVNVAIFNAQIEIINPNIAVFLYQENNSMAMQPIYLSIYDLASRKFIIKSKYLMINMGFYSSLTQLAILKNKIYIFYTTQNRIYPEADPKTGQRPNIIMSQEYLKCNIYEIIDNNLLNTKEGILLDESLYKYNASNNQTEGYQIEDRINKQLTKIIGDKIEISWIAKSFKDKTQIDTYYARLIDINGNLDGAKYEKK